MKNIYVFDMGNVILKPSNLRGMYEEANGLCTYQEFRNYFYHSLDAYQVYTGELSDQEFFYRVSHVLQTSKNYLELMQLYLKYKGGVYEEVIRLLNELRSSGHDLCLLSNLKPIDYRYLCKTMDLFVFDYIFLSYKMGVAKPDKKIYKDVIKKLGTRDFYFFDDTKENVDAATKLGIKAYQTTGKTLKRVLPR